MALSGRGNLSITLPVAQKLGSISTCKIVSICELFGAEAVIPGQQASPGFLPEPGKEETNRMMLPGHAG